MENKINVAKLLKDCPKGMELDCTIWDNDVKVFLKEVLNDDSAYPICVTVKYNNIEYSKSFTKYGSFNDLPYCKCVIFPKGKTTWEESVSPCKFKVGDRVRNKNNKNSIFNICNITDKGYEVIDIDTDFPSFIRFGSYEDNYELYNKFDITTLIPFESKVLIRDNKFQKWYPGIWGVYDSNSEEYPYKTIGCTAQYCIPYEGNQHLLYTTNDCDEFYKTWK